MAEIVVPVASLLLSERLWKIIEKIMPNLEKISSKTLKGKLRDLDRKMKKIHSELAPVERSGIHHANHWQRQIREVIFDAEYLLDDIEIEERSGHTSIQVPRLFHSDSSVHNAIGVFKEQLGDLNKTYESIEVLVADEQLKEDTVPVFEGGVFIGRKDEIKKIVEFLLSDSSNDNNNTCSIVGIGGVGKTALAQVICQHERVKKKLELKWVHVGFKKFDLKKLLLQIGGNLETNNTLEEQRIILEKSLGKKTHYLFVLDDLWDISQFEWKRLKSMLLNINKGNKFLITTRNPKITAIAAAKDKTVFLKPLKPDECLPLIEEYAKSDALLSPTITEEIIKECEGVPLAAITLGIKLSEGTIRGGDIWSFRDVEEQGSIMNSLKFSYDYLPPHLKDCFAYHVVCNDLHKESLTQMWTAQGFIEEPDDGNTSFEKLQNASFFHDVEEHIFPGTQFKVLKLFRSLILLVSKEYAYASTSESEITGVSRRTRHVSLSPQHPKQKVQKPCLREKLRTVVGPHEIGSLSKFRGLRVLVLFGVEFESSAISLGNLKHLRYLDLSQNKNLEVISKFLGKLLFLETLRVTCEDLKKLPNEIDKLTNLRYLYASSDQASLEFRGLSSLQTLHLKNFQKLEKLPEMSYFTELETLEILDCPRLCCREVDLKDLTSLKRLAISNLPRLQTVPVGPVSSGLKLNSIHLLNCENLTNLTEGFRILTSLERLTIEGCPGLESSFAVEGRNILPCSLKLLRINRCDELIKRCESEEGRDDVSWIKEVYLNGVLLINPVSSSSSSSDWSQIFSWLMRWIITRLRFYFAGTGVLTEGSNTEVEEPAREETSASTEEPSNVPPTSSTQQPLISRQNSVADPPNANGEGSSTRPHQSDRNSIGKVVRNGFSNVKKVMKRKIR